MYSSSVWIGRPIALQLLALVAMSLSWQVALKSSCQTLPLKAGQTNEQPPSLTVGKHQLNPVAITTPNQVSFGICKLSPKRSFYMAHLLHFQSSFPKTVIQQKLFF